MGFFKKLSLAITIILLVIVIVTICSGTWLLDSLGSFSIWTGNAMKTAGKFLNFFGIGG